MKKLLHAIWLWRMRRAYSKFLKCCPHWANRPEAFGWFCTLEQLGVERVRFLLESGYPVRDWKQFINGK